MNVRRAPETVLLLVTVGALLLALASAAGTSAVDFGEGWVFRGGAPVEEPPPAPAREEPDTPTVIGSIAAVGLGMLLLVMLVMVVFGLIITIGAIRFQFRRRRRGQVGVRLDEDIEDAGGDPQPARAAMRRAARQALEQLRGRTGGDPGDAVVAAWLVLEQAAEEAGSARAAYQTPTEFTTAVLTRHDVDSAALARLRGLYQRARFGTGTVVTEADVAAAAAALETLVDELAGSRA